MCSGMTLLQQGGWTRSPHWGPLQPNPSHEGHQKRHENPTQESSSLEEAGKMPGEQEQAERRDLRHVPRLQPVLGRWCHAGVTKPRWGSPSPAPPEPGLCQEQGQWDPSPEPGWPQAPPDPPSKAQARPAQSERGPAGISAFPSSLTSTDSMEEPSTGAEGSFLSTCFTD